MASGQVLDLLLNGFLDWAAKNKYTFILIALMGANVYQYIECAKTAQVHRKELNDIYQQQISKDKEQIEYERNRSEKLESLLNQFSEGNKNK